jgi:hypothetical protein
MLLEMSSNGSGEGIYVLFDVVCLHSFNSERIYPVFVKAVKHKAKGFLGTFFVAYFGRPNLGCTV